VISQDEHSKLAMLIAEYAKARVKTACALATNDWAEGAVSLREDSEVTSRLMDYMNSLVEPK
jgi:hypothetical protein